MAGPAPLPVGAPVATRRPGRWRRVLLVVVVIVGAVCLSGGVVGYFWYDRATSPDRSAPDVVVDNYLREFLVNRDDGKAAEFACRDQSGLAPIKELRADLQAREQRYAIQITVSWGQLVVTGKAGTREVAVKLTVHVPEANGSSSESLQQWTFQTRDQSGWRTCGAARNG